MAQNEMKAKAGVPEHVSSIEGLGHARFSFIGEAYQRCGLEQTCIAADSRRACGTGLQDVDSGSSRSRLMRHFSGDLPSRCNCLQLGTAQRQAHLDDLALDWPTFALFGCGRATPALGFPCRSERSRRRSRLSIASRSEPVLLAGPNVGLERLAFGQSARRQGWAYVVT